MPRQSLAEVFGFPTDNLSAKAERYRKNRLCPYNNRVANCTKDKANDPLGVCSVFGASGEIAITCPIRFRQDWLIAEDAARFFFPQEATWTSLSEVRLNDRNGVSAGNIDVVLVSYDDRGRMLDFGALEVQAVYISGNVRVPFEKYMDDPDLYNSTDWSRQTNRPRPDYLSSSRKRLVPQLIYKGSILKSWGKKQAVALHRGFIQPCRFSTKLILKSLTLHGSYMTLPSTNKRMNINSFYIVQSTRFSSLLSTKSLRLSRAQWKYSLSICRNGLMRNSKVITTLLMPLHWTSCCR